MRASATVALVAAAVAWSARAEPAVKCDLNGLTILVQLTREDQNGDPNGQVDPWGLVAPDVTAVSPSSVEPLTGFWQWRVVATADFNADGACDLAWTRDVDGQSMEVALGLTDDTLDPPTLKVPDGRDPAYAVAADWSVVGSGDFGTTNSATGALELVSDGRPELLLWNAATRRLAIWINDEGQAFAEANRYAVDVGPGHGNPAVAANLDGQRTSGIVWRDGRRLTYGRLRQGAAGDIVYQSLGELLPGSPLAPQWTIRGASDFDGDGKHELILQHDVNDRVVVWFMDGTTHTGGAYLSPSVLASTPSEPSAPDQNDPPHWEIVGPR